MHAMMIIGGWVLISFAVSRGLSLLGDRAIQRDIKQSLANFERSIKLQNIEKQQRTGL
jgi:hypothetical protein